ncbi:MAG TPA: thiamine-phosphate kinase [Caulobacteraceae bacterium]|jgi:thiamine-monophosphate kinase|nr:thiamine-phosphate kinase [Caulobacteraceae bacterium]
MSDRPDEFAWIAALRPLASSAAALGLMDDTAVLPGRPGYDLVISEDAMVEGVHFLVGEDAAIVARRLLRTNVSDLAAKAAEPFGYTLMTAWPPTRGWADQEAFIAGLADDGETLGLTLLGGDTVSTPGPLTVSATVFGWVPSGRAVRRSGAKPGDLLVVLGDIGNGLLGLKAARGEIDDPHGELARAYRLPEPSLHLRTALRAHATAAADVSDGLLADALHIAEASGCALTVDLERLPISGAAAAWVRAQPDPAAAMLALATGGDDYALVCASAEAPALILAAEELETPARIAGRFEGGRGLTVRYHGTPLAPERMGWRHL